LQVFCANPRRWNPFRRGQEEFDVFRSSRSKAELEPLFVHSCYLINCCAPQEDVFDKSVSRLAYELEVAALLGADAYVLHPGSCKERGAGWRLRRAAQAILQALHRTPRPVSILLESTATPHGPGGDLTRLGELAVLLESSSVPVEVGFCIDSCHVFARGYDLRSEDEVDRMVADIEGAAGPGRVRLLHLNDSRDGCGSGRDRHQHLGQGSIGATGLRNFLMHPALRALPVILETPWESEAADRGNLGVARRLARPCGHVKGERGGC